MAKGLMDENPATICSIRVRTTVPSARDEGREGESREHHRVGADESAKTTDTNSFATQSTTKWVITEIWGSKTCGNSH